VVKASAIAAALPEYMKFPALREMHQPLAAGKTIAADVAEDGKTYITAKVVDPVAIKKVKEGVYAGFSIGGNVPPGGRSKDNPKIIEQIKLVEISLVDRPANPEAVFTLVKIEAEARRPSRPRLPRPSR
jgi:phage head maturation protease